MKNITSPSYRSSREKNLYTKNETDGKEEVNDATV
jgi:hypothetical protein